MVNRYVDLVGEPHFIDRDGCRIAYRLAGNKNNRTTLLLFSAWQIAHSGAWKAQAPYLANFYRVITIDCRGNGLSDRPNTTEAYLPTVLVDDALAILDQEKRSSAVVLGFSYGGHLAALFAATYPSRCDGAVLFAPSAPFGPHNPHMTPENMNAERQHYEGWQKFNFQYWQNHYHSFIEFFIRQVFSENYSHKQIEDALEWAGETDAQTLIHTVAARADNTGQCEDMYASIHCPVLIVHGNKDAITPIEKSRLVASLCHAKLIELPDSAHMPSARIPGKINQIIRSFVDEITNSDTAPPTAALSQAPLINTRGFNRPPKALYLSSPIGLGHVRRDQAIATALRQQRPELQIDWLAQSPVTEYLTAAGEKIHPISPKLISESQHVESQSGEHDLNVFQAFRRMDAILVSNFSLFQDVVNTGDYDLVIADEAWDIDRFWHEHPGLKKTKLAWMTDFVGVLPMAAQDTDEMSLARDWNAEMISLIDQSPTTRDAALFIGDEIDVVDVPFGEGLPSIREWTSANHAFPGYINPIHDLPEMNIRQFRDQQGFSDEHIVCLVAVGGSGIGRQLIQRLLSILPQLRTSLPALVFNIITGPRISLHSLPQLDGVIYHAFVPDFLSHIRACDLAIVQGGLSTTMELTCLGKPFLYVPLELHFEQQIHVHHRLQRYGIGERVTYADLHQADELALKIQRLLVKKISDGQKIVPDTGGAERAAKQIAALI